MNNRVDIQNELKELNSSLQAAAPSQVYAVPEGYFDSFAASVLTTIKSQQADPQSELEELSPLLASIPRVTPYQVPDGYFEVNNGSLPFQLGEDKLPALFQLIDKNEPYSVPAGYFEELPARIMARVAPRQARVVSMPRRWMRSALAAAVIGIIAVSGFFYFNRPKPISVDDPRWVAQKIKTVDTKSLENFIKTTDIDASSKETAITKRPTEDVKVLLKDVSTSELESFLEQVPTEDEDLLMVN